MKPQQIILITGTPCVGKTTLAKQLANQLKAFYINLTDYAKQNNLILSKDVQRDTLIINEKKMRQTLTNTINQSKHPIIVIDGHFATSVVPNNLSTFVFVLRRNPIELETFMQKEGFSETKMYENLSAEILDICLVEAITKHTNKVCEIDITGKSVEQSINEILSVLHHNKNKCLGGNTIDWLEFLEQKGLAEHYLKIDKLS
jgi:adenylate kinase